MVKDTKTGECLRADHLLEGMMLELDECFVCSFSVLSDVMEVIIKDPKSSQDLKDRASKISAMVNDISHLFTLLLVLFIVSVGSF